MRCAGLPADSRTVLALRGHDWTQTDELLAAVVDELRAANWLFIKANVTEETNVPVPDPVHRPYAPEPPEPAPPVMATAADLAAFVGPGSAGRVAYTPAVTDG